MTITGDGSEVRWHAGTFNNGLIFSATYHGVTHLPRRCSYGIGHVGTWIAYRTVRRGTRALIENLRVVRPDASRRELERLALLTYRSYARDTIDFIRAISMSRAQFEPLVAGLVNDVFAELFAEGRGIILVGGHFGNWELGGVLLRLLRGYPLTVVGRPEPSPVVAAIRQRMRETLGIETVEIGRMLETALTLRRVLATNSIVGMLLDRHLGKDRVEVTFFGRPTSFARSPAMVAHLSGAPLLPAFMIRQPDDRFLAVCGSPIKPDPSLPAEDSVRAMTQAFARQLEEQIRARPYLWYQFYPYWQG